MNDRAKMEYRSTYYSTDGGKTWKISNITNGNHKFFNWKGKTFAIGWGGPATGTGYNIYYTTNGSTWTTCSGLPTNTQISANPYFKNGKILISPSTDRGLYSSTDGVTWTKVTTDCRIIADVDGVLLTEKFKQSKDGVNWIDTKPSELTNTAVFMCTGEGKMLAYGNSITWVANTCF